MSSQFRKSAVAIVTAIATAFAGTIAMPASPVHAQTTRNHADKYEPFFMPDGYDPATRTSRVVLGWGGSIYQKPPVVRVRPASGYTDDVFESFSTRRIDDRSWSISAVHFPKVLAPGRTGVPMEVTYADGSSEVAPAMFDYKPEPKVTITSGGTYITMAAGREATFDIDQRFFVEGVGRVHPVLALTNETKKKYPWVRVSNDGTKIVAAPPVGTSADVEVKAVAMFRDIPVFKPINVTATFGVQPRIIPKVVYRSTKVTAGDTAEVPAPSPSRGEDITGLRFRKAAGAPSWVTVAADGAVTVSPGRDVSGEFFVPVELYEPETGRSRVAEVHVLVLPAPAPSLTTKTNTTATAKPSLTTKRAPATTAKKKPTPTTTTNPALTTKRPALTTKPAMTTEPSTQRSTTSTPTQQPTLTTQQTPGVSGSSFDARSVDVVLAVLALLGVAGFVAVSQNGQNVQ